MAKNLMPKKGAQLSDSGFPAASLVCYENDGVPIIAVVLGFKRDKYCVLNDRGREVELQAIRMHALPGSLPSDKISLEAKTKYLNEISKGAAEVAAEISIEELWSVVASQQRSYQVKELCELYFSNNELERHFGVWLALIQDKVFFKRTKEGFLPRALSTVDELRRAEARHQEKMRMRRETLEFFRARLSKQQGGAHIDIPSQIQPMIELLEEIASGAAHIDNQSQREAKDMVDLADSELGLNLHGNREQRVFALLCAIGHFSRNTNLALYRNRLPREFKPEENECAAHIKLPETIEAWRERDKVHASQRGARIDLTALDCFTIDDISTRDMDDAISLEQTQGGYRVGIHISDVASVVEPDSILDLAARCRATSVYLPEAVVHMLPPEIAENKASLIAGAVRPCLSCLARFDHAFTFLAADIVPSLIRVQRRYTYDQVDALLEEENGTLQTLYAIATSHETSRLEGGAMKIYKRDLQISLDQSGNPTIMEFDEHGPARSLVGECMVVANKVLAEYAKSNKLAVVYRLQDPPDKDRVRASTGAAAPSDGPAADYSARAILKKSTTSLNPGPHAGLGLDAYLQGTSPIRRYVDLINQRQILHHLRTGNGLYSSEELLKLLYETDQPLERASAVTKETRRFWLLRYLELRMEKRASHREPFTIQGCVLRTDLKHPLVELDEVFMPVIVRTDKPVKVGDVLTLRLVSINPQSDFIRLEMM